MSILTRVAAFNEGLAARITARVGTMWTAYLFAVIGVAGVVGALTNNVGLVLIVGAVSGYFLQLVLLPIIMVGQDVQAKALTQTILETHDAALEAVAELHRVLRDLRDPTEPPATS